MTTTPSSNVWNLLFVVFDLINLFDLNTLWLIYWHFLCLACMEWWLVMDRNDIYTSRSGMNAIKIIDIVFMKKFWDENGICYALKKKRNSSCMPFQMKLLRVFASLLTCQYFKIRDRSLTDAASIQFESFQDSFNTNIINKYARKQIN